MARHGVHSRFGRSVSPIRSADVAVEGVVVDVQRVAAVGLAVVASVLLDAAVAGPPIARYVVIAPGVGLLVPMGEPHGGRSPDAPGLGQIADARGRAAVDARHVAETTDPPGPGVEE